MNFFYYLVKHIFIQASVSYKYIYEFMYVFLSKQTVHHMMSFKTREYTHCTSQG